MTNYVIIDSITYNIQGIQNVLSNLKRFKPISTSITKPDILNCILDDNIELVFFNIDVANELLQNLIYETNIIKINSPKFIAMSNQKEKAYDAIKLGFCDFLLLPLNEKEVQKSIFRLESLKEFTNKKRICIKSYKDYQYLDLDKIAYLKADNNTTDFFLLDQTEVSAYKTLKTFENSLPPNFIRIHRSYIINVNFISRIQYGKNTCTVKYLNTEIPFSKTYLDNIKKIVRFLNDKSVPL